MGSITGFNTSAAGAFSAGEPLSASKLNRLATGIELAKTQFSDGLLFQGGPSGVPYTVQTDNQLLEASAPQQFDMYIDKVEPDNPDNKFYALHVARGVIYFRSSPNAFTGGCLKEFRMESFAVSPKSSLVVGTENGSDWCAKNGYVQIRKASDGGSDNYGVYIIANQYKVGGGTLEAGTAYLAVMPVGGDAETKTRPWGSESSRCDRQVWWSVNEAINVSVETPGGPPYYEPTYVSGYLFQSVYNKLYNYNCQRICIAQIYWNGDDKRWDIVHFGYGPITIPYNCFLAGNYLYDPNAGDPPEWFSTPYNATNQEDWEGTFTDCDKWDGTGYNPTSMVVL